MIVRTGRIFDQGDEPLGSIDSPEFLLQQKSIGRSRYGTVELEELMGVDHADLGVMSVVVSTIVKNSEIREGN